MTEYYLDDLAPGATFRTATLTVDAEAIVAFAAQFDPQPFHLDAAAATASIFGQLVASGWHTASLTMRLLVGGELRIAGGYVGLGVSEMSWPRAVVAGDSLYAVAEILAVRPSTSRPDRGTIQLRTTTYNQRAEPVLVMTSLQLVPRRPSA